MNALNDNDNDKLVSAVGEKLHRWMCLFVATADHPKCMQLSVERSLQTDRSTN